MTAELLDQARDLLAAVASASFGTMSDEALCTLIGSAEEAGRLLDATRALAAAEIEERSRIELGRDGLAQRHGHARGSHLIEGITRVPQGEAVRRIRLGSQSDPARGCAGTCFRHSFLQSPRPSSAVR